MMIKTYRLIFLILILFSQGSFSQISKPCITKNMDIDLSCRCEKNQTCFKSLSKLDKEAYKKSVKTPRDKKLFEIAMKARQLEDDLFSNKATLNDPRFSELDVLNGKLSKLNDKMRKEYEKKLKGDGHKKWQLKDRQMAVIKLWNNLIPKKRWGEINQGGPGFSLTKMIASHMGSTSIPITDAQMFSEKTTKQMLDDKLSAFKESDEAKKTVNNVEVSNVALIDKQVESNLKTKNYKVNDIHPAHNDLWQVISGRYIRIQNRLDSRAILLGSRSIDQKKVKSSILQQLNMM